MFCSRHKLALLFICLTGFSAIAQNDFSDVQIQTSQLTDHVYMLTGAGGNIGLSAGEDGVFIIDDQFSPLHDKIIAAIAEISDQPVRFVINTHWHGDHTGGNEAFGDKGSTIVAHDNVHKRMSTDQYIKRFDAEVPAAPRAALPIVSFNDQLSLHLNGESVTAYYQRDAHTDGDSVVHFAGSNVIHMGDTFFNGTYPFFDLSSGGSIDGLISASQFTITLANDDTQIIPGHGPLANKTDLQAYHDMLVQVRSLIKVHVDAGKTLEETQAAAPTAALDEQWGQGFINAESIVSFVYESLAQ